MKDIITSGLWGIAVLLMMFFAAPILNEKDINKSIVGTENIVQEDIPVKEIEIDSNIHTPL